ncbi:MAG: hypothetical protein ACKOGA_05875 [Planctomycetaceae bacterium]
MSQKTHSRARKPRSSPGSRNVDLTLRVPAIRSSCLRWQQLVSQVREELCGARAGEWPASNRS